MPTPNQPRKESKTFVAKWPLKLGFYRKPEYVDLWLGERSNTERWQQPCLKALTTLNVLQIRYLNWSITLASGSMSRYVQRCPERLKL